MRVGRDFYINKNKIEQSKVFNPNEWLLDILIKQLNNMNFERYVRIATGIRPIHYNNLRFFHVTFILNKSQIMAVGINKFRTHSFNLRHNSYISREGINISDKIGTHSEISSILAFGKEDCSDYTFLNIRLNLDNELRYSAPCAGCKFILSQVGFRKIYYSNSDGTFGEIK